MYISPKLSYRLRSDLNICSPKELESTFVEILIPKKQNLIVGTIYNHSPMKLHKFNNIFLELLFKTKNQIAILAGDLNLNLLNYNKKGELHARIMSRMRFRVNLHSIVA